MVSINKKLNIVEGVSHVYNLCISNYGPSNYLILFFNGVLL